MDALLAQLIPTGDVEQDVTDICKALEQRPEADLAVFPELYIGGYETARPDRVALEEGGPELARIGRSCAEHETAAIVGFTEKLDGSTFGNSAACFDSTGKIVGIYRKTHLYGPNENAAYTASNELKVIDLDGTAVGPLICFDMEFPEPARLLALNGARLLVTISANMAPMGPDHRVAAQARALDNRLPHLYVNRIGSVPGIDFVGGSCLIGPDGSVREDTGAAEGTFEVSVPLDDGPSPDVDYLKQLRNDLVVTKNTVPSGGES